MTGKKRQVLMILAAVLVLIIICGVMFILGRGHTVYFDLKEMDYNGQNYQSPYKVEVYVKGERVAKLYDDERGMATWIGQSFNMKLVVTDVKGGAEREADVAFTLPYNMDGITVNLTGILAGVPTEACLAEFVIVAEEPAEEEPVVDEFGLTEEAVPEA